MSYAKRAVECADTLPYNECTKHNFGYKWYTNRSSEFSIQSAVLLMYNAVLVIFTSVHVYDHLISQQPVMWCNETAQNCCNVVGIGAIPAIWSSFIWPISCISYQEKQKTRNKPFTFKMRKRPPIIVFCQKFTFIVARIWKFDMCRTKIWQV